MPRRFLRKPVAVEAEQFLGWQNAEDICKWIPGAFFVPQGYEHALRTEHEHDRSRGDVLDTAEAFIVIPGNTSDEKIRVDRFWWIVLDQGMVKIFPDAKSVNEQYELAPGESNYGWRP